MADKRRTEENGDSTGPLKKPRTEGGALVAVPASAGGALIEVVSRQRPCLISHLPIFLPRSSANLTQGFSEKNSIIMCMCVTLNQGGIKRTSNLAAPTMLLTGHKVLSRRSSFNIIPYSYCCCYLSCVVPRLMWSGRSIHSSLQS